MSEPLDLTNQRFGRLLVLEEVEPNGPYYHKGRTFWHRRWRCECDCGAETVVIQGELRRGATISCGCYRDEQSSKRAFAFPKARGRGWQRRTSGVRLSMPAARAIRDLYATGAWRQGELAAAYGVNAPMISHVVTGRAWREGLDVS